MFQFYSKYCFSFAFFTCISNDFFFPVQQQKLTGLFILSTRSDVMKIFGLIGFPGQREQSLCTNPSIRNLLSFFLTRANKQHSSWLLHEDSIHGLTLLSTSLNILMIVSHVCFELIKMLVFEVSDCLYRLLKYEGTDLGLERKTPISTYGQEMCIHTKHLLEAIKLVENMVLNNFCFHVSAETNERCCDRAFCFNIYILSLIFTFCYYFCHLLEKFN